MIEAPSNASYVEFFVTSNGNSGTLLVVNSTSEKVLYNGTTGVTTSRSVALDVGTHSITLEYQSSQTIAFPKRIMLTIRKNLSLVGISFPGAYSINGVLSTTPHWKPTNASLTSLAGNKIELSWLTKDLVLSLARSSNTIIGTTSQGVEVEILLWNSSIKFITGPFERVFAMLKKSMRLTKKCV